MKPASRAPHVPDRRFVIATVAATLGLVSALFGNTSSVSADTAYFPILTGANEVPGPGDPNGDGGAQIDIDPASGIVCATWDIVGIDTATAAHIHAGAAGVAGAVVVTLPTPNADGGGGDCVNGLDSGVLQAIVDAPDAYYVNVHTDAFPNGAIRGQLGEPIEFFQLRVIVIACPAGHVITPAFEGIPEGCTLAMRPGDIPPLDPGYSYATEPLAVDLDFEIDDGGDPLSVADGSWEGGNSCNTVTFVCTLGGSFVWGPVFSGDTSIRQITIPNGYQLAGAVIFRDNDAGQVLGTSSTSTVTFDSAGVNSIDLRLYDVAVAAPGPTPRPTAAVTLPPTSAELPVATPPAGPTPAFVGIGLMGLAAAFIAFVLPHRPKRKR
jgi:hypothetical protein